MSTKRMLVLFPILLAALAGCAKKPPTSQDDLDRKFKEMMRGVTLVGRSTRTKDDSVIGSEKYVIEKVTKLTGETWLFQARLQYGGHDVPVPVPVVIKWAGDTPVITMTDVAVPGMGSFTVRLLLYGDQYAGTWSAKDHGGTMFGKIMRNP